MPVQELFIVMDNIYHGFRRCFGPENQNEPRTFPAYNAMKKIGKRRRRIFKSKLGWQYVRRNHFSSSEESFQNVTASELNGYFTRGKFPAPITVSHEPNISPSIGLVHRRRLQNRPLMLNARQVLQVQWSGWWQRYWPTLVAASMQMSCGSSVLCHSLLGLYDDEESSPPIVVLICHFGQAIKKLCKKADLAICSNGRSPNYVTTSAAMELIDIRGFFQHINNALVDFLLRAADSGMYML
ncbi:uncharacterized protein LOC120454120 [Drosophila santomea]|uniref:uncharacterized protein LOC120454120 n=1 Tax=Drosophila santomea TaxID=129105 RepID=UPI001953DDC8|nr:uncharacterized protein LOC120454120 [Drosophila santomea]XP_039495089.1 uncharacterized protein LOC120454120 [Drosophila santomea]